ncbi:MAG: serine--tRNA ligase [Proteobacteria bacterium SG_bin7]|nr:MAG: serine--tRNA ligase [Proteobacteria bacterium SG_bin7]
MLDLKELENEVYYKKYAECLKARNGDTSLIEKLVEENKKRKKLIFESEALRAEQNRVSEVIGKLKREKTDASKQLADMQELAGKFKALNSQLDEVQKRVGEIALQLPNMPHESTPKGSSSDDNVEVRKIGEPKKLPFKAKEHQDVGLGLGQLDLERGAKVTGTRFYFLLGQLAHLERALMNFMLDMHTQKHDYREMVAPYIVNSNSMKGTGQFPKFFDEVFHLQGTDYHLIPTAETSVTNYFAEEILDEAKLPYKFVGFSPCFRAEAGAAGKDTKGILRVHQFQKVELLKFTHPDQSYEEHEKLTRNAEQVLRELELPYRVMQLCTGDISFSAAKCYDLEVWLPGQNAYREISSCSNFEAFQARRANIRFKSKGGKPQFVHTINGSGLAIGRTLIAILENYQQEDGSVLIPKALQPYMNGKTKIDKQ